MFLYFISFVQIHGTMKDHLDYFEIQLQVDNFHGKNHGYCQSSITTESWKGKYLLLNFVTGLDVRMVAGVNHLNESFDDHTVVVRVIILNTVGHYDITRYTFLFLWGRFRCQRDGYDPLYGLDRRWRCSLGYREWPFESGYLVRLHSLTLIRLRVRCCLQFLRWSLSGLWCLQFLRRSLSGLWCQLWDRRHYR